jgi:uncharacterized protein (TIGR02996 family)
MQHETFLLLNLLDRPRDAGLRLVYADWLEQDGQDALARWHRLNSSISKMVPGDKQRRWASNCARELAACHVGQWVELCGLLFSWDAIIQVLRQRLAETIAWCQSPDREGLRTSGLLPRQSHGLDRGPLWQCASATARTSLVHQLANRRAANLSKADVGVEPLPDAPLPGRLLLFDVDRSRQEGRATLYTGGYLDSYQTPPWDTWIAYFDDGAPGRLQAQRHWEAEWIMRRPVKPVTFPAYTAAWVPAEFVEKVEWGYEVLDKPPFEWAENVDCALTKWLGKLGFVTPAAGPRSLMRREQRTSQMR